MTPITINSRGDPEKQAINNIKTKIIRVKRLVASNKEQMIVRCKIFLPHQKPEIQEILCIKEFMHDHHIETVFGRVLIEGNITFEVNYLSEKQNQHNQLIASSTYYDFIDIPEATTEMVADVKAMVDSVTLVGFKNETRTITVDVALSNAVLLYEFIEKSFITDLPSNCNGKFEEISLNEIIDVAKGRLKGFEEISVPLRCPVKKIIKCKSMPLIQNYEVNLGSVTVYGWFKINVFYLDNNDQKRWTERFIPFNKILAVPKAKKQLISEVFVTSHQMDYSLLPNKGLYLKYNICFKACLFEPLTISVLTESNSLSAKNESFVCESLADIQSIETVIREFSEINNDLLGMEIKDVRVGPAKFLFKQLVNNKVLLRGYVDFLVGYMPNQTKNTKYLLKKGFFKAVVEVNDATNNSKIELIPIINFTNIFFKEDKLTINSLLNIIVKVLNLKSITVVTKIDCPNSNTAENNEVFFTYVMQHDDKLEELATRFGTTVEAIYKANPELTQPFASKKIHIPCQVKKN